MNSRPEGLSLPSDTRSFPDNRMWRVKVNPIRVSYRGASQQGFSKPESCIEEVLCTIGKGIAFLSFPPLFVERYLLQAGEDASRVPGQRLCNCPGRGAGFITGKDSPGLLCRRPPNPFSLEERKKGEGNNRIMLLPYFLYPHRRFQIF